MIQVGDKIPSVKLNVLGENGIEEIDTAEFFAGKTVVLFGLPGAFTPTCTAKHLPGYIENFETLKAKGVDEIACLSVNDAFVMKAWGDQQGATGKIVLLPDGIAEFTKALGLDIDMTERKLGVRSKRFALIAEDGKVTHLAVEDSPGALNASAAETILEKL